MPGPITDPSQLQDGPVTDPSQVDPSLPAPEQSMFGPEWERGRTDSSPLQPGLKRVDVSSNGMTNGGLAKSAKLFGSSDQRVAQFSAQDQQQTDEQQRRSAANYQQYGEGVNDEIDATKHYEDRNQELQQQQVDFNNHAAQLEERLSGEAKAERERYLGAYQEQLAGVRQLAMESGNPIGKLSRSSAGGLMGAQFAQGFLAARGIQIDVTGQIDRWVDRSIQEHQQRIQNARADANDQLHLYEIARQSSQDDWEARQRYRGFVIQGLQTAVQMNAARFQSSVAVAHAREQVAKLQIEGDATARTIGDAHFNRVHQFMQTEYQRAYQQGSLAIESQKLAIEREKNEIAKAKATKEAKYPSYVVDPTQAQRGDNGKRTTGGKVVAVYNPDAPGVTKAAENISSASGYHGNVLSGIDRLRDLKPAGATWNSFLSKTSSPEYRRFDAARSALLNDLLVANSGKAVTDSEYARYKALLADNSKWQKGDNDSLLNEMEYSSRRKLNAVFHAEQAAGNIRILRPDEAVDPRFGAQGRYMPYEGDLDPATGAVQDADTHGGKPVRGFAEVEASVGQDATDTKEGPPSRAYTELVATDKGQQQPHNTVAVELLARAVLDPHHARAAFADGAAPIPDDDNLVRKQALEALANLAGAKDGFVAGYASIMLDKLHTDPDELRSLLVPRGPYNGADVGSYKTTRK